MGSEMCIRDRDTIDFNIDELCWLFKTDSTLWIGGNPKGLEQCFCLLYTSDAADERSSVDLGGRRIIKNKSYDTSLSDVVSYKIMI